MKCIFCKNDSVSIETDRSYERHLGENVFFEYKLLKCHSCFAEFLDDALSEFNAKSHSEMHINLTRKLFKVSFDLIGVLSYEESHTNTMMISNMYESLEKITSSAKESMRKQEIMMGNFIPSKSITTSNSCYA